MRRTTIILTLGLAAAAAPAAWQSVGPDGGYILAMAIDPRDARQLYASPYDYPDSARLFLSTDAGASWTNQGRVPDAYLTSLAVDPLDHDRIYASGRGDVIHRTTDRGLNWVSTILPGYGVALAADPLAAGRLYVSGLYIHGGNFRAAAYISTNHGASWSVAMPCPDTVGYAYAVAADPVAAGTVYLGASGAQLFKSTDGGASWQRASSGIPSGSSVMGVSVSPGDNRIVLAATTDGFYRTTDGGASWQAVGAVSGAVSVEFSPVDGSLAYAVGRSDSLRVWVSTDAGETWNLPSPGYVTLKTASLHPDPAAAATAWMSSQTGIYRSTDTACNWSEAHTGLRITRISCISPSPANGRRLYLEVHENGIFRTESAGDSWTRCSDFLACGNICGIGVAPGTDLDVLYALEGAG